MERRILISGVILTISIIIMIGVFFIHSKSKDNANPIKSIPQDASIVLKLNGFKLPSDLISKKSKVWEDILSVESVKRVNNEIATIDSLMRISPKFFEAVSENDIYISGHITGGRKLYFLSVVPLPDGMNQKELIRLARQYQGIQISERKYEGKSIINVRSNRNMYFAFVNGLLLYSSSPVLIEDAIRQNTLETSLLENPGFSKMVEATGKNKDANLFIDLKEIGKLTSLFSSSDVAKKFREYNKFGGWIELDINLKEDLILLNGFSYPTDSAFNYLRTISGHTPVRLTLHEVLPSNISGFIAYGISSPKDFYKNYKNYLDETNRLANYNANLKNMNSKYGVDFDKFFLDLIDDQIALAHKNVPSTSEGSEFLIIKCKSGNHANEKMEELIKKLGSSTEGKLKYTYSPDNEIEFPIYRIPIYPLFGRLFGNFFNVLEENYIVIAGNYLIVADSYKEASQFLYDFLLKRTLSNNETFQDFSNHLSMKSFLLIYANMQKTDQYFARYLNQKTLESWRNSIDASQKTQTLGIQIGEVSNLPYFNVFLKHHESHRGKPKTVWESLLDTTISQKPKFVTNHYTKQNEIVIQDDYNNLYLLNQAGRILWKIPLNEKINSDIFQIDFYKNGKLQLIFSTETGLHLIDRNGNYVERYPIKLRSKATAGMSLFDYESNKNYRIFIPCQDKKVYAYSKEGDIISGWKFAGSDHFINQPAKHFRVGNKDYIVFGDKNKAYILDRKGNIRINPGKSISKSPFNNFYLYNAGNIANSFFVTSNTSGEIVKVFFNGNIEKQKLNPFSENHYFDFKDVNADGKSDYIFLDNKDLKVYDMDGALIFEKTFKEKVIKRPVYYHFSYTDRKMGIVTQDEQIHLINNNGEYYKGFPVEGKTQFTVGYFDLTSSRFNLIVGGRNNFLYNYAVE